MTEILEIIGAVFVGGAVLIGGADSLERFEVVLVEVLAAVEHQVFEQVSEAGAAGLFIFRADVIPDVDGNNRRFMVFVDESA